MGNVKRGRPNSTHTPPKPYHIVTHEQLQASLQALGGLCSETFVERDMLFTYLQNYDRWKRQNRWYRRLFRWLATIGTKPATAVVPPTPEQPEAAAAASEVSGGPE